MALLAIGITDEDAAQRLGWSDRTLRRHLRSAMDKLGAGSRLQAGFNLALSGWIPASPGAAHDSADAGSGQAPKQVERPSRRNQVEG